MSLFKGSHESLGAKSRMRILTQVMATVHAVHSGEVEGGNCKTGSHVAMQSTGAECQMRDST